MTEEAIQLGTGLRAAGLGKSLQLAQVAVFHGAASQQPSGVLTALIEKLRQCVQIVASPIKVGKPVHCGLVALVREGAKGFFVEVVFGHETILRPCPKGKVKCDNRAMLTIGQLATYVGVTTKAVRVYHAKGLLPEPERDSSGYRRYDAQAIIDLTRIVTLAQAGVPLSRIPAVLDADAATEQIDQIDTELRDHIHRLEQRRLRLRHLDQPDRLCLPAEAIRYMERLRVIGLSERHEHAIRDGWILSYAVAPDIARSILAARTAQLDDAAYVAVLRGYDQAIDWEPDDPRLADIARGAAQLAQRVTVASDLPGFDQLPAETVDILTGHQGLESAAWKRLDELLHRTLTEQAGRFGQNSPGGG